MPDRIDEFLKAGDDEARCDRCARFGAIEVGDRRLCEDCYSCAGSCCPEFGADDLWPKDEDDADDAPTG